MEEWLFANQPALTPESVKNAAATVGGVTDFDARFAATLELVKGDTGQAAQLKVTGTPTFFMNGIRLPGLRAEFFDAAIAWELKQVQSKKVAGRGDRDREPHQGFSCRVLASSSVSRP